MFANRRTQIFATSLSRKAESYPSALLASVGTGVMILGFGAAWFAFLRGLTALGRMLMVWHFTI